MAALPEAAQELIGSVALGAEQRKLLAHVYRGSDVKGPPMDDPPSGDATCIAFEQVGGVGTWA